MGRGAAVRNRKLHGGSTDSEPLAARMRLPNKKQRKIMDELLLNSNLRRADDVSNGLIRATQPILREKPTTPFIVLPEEARFAPLIKKSRYALDIGGTLVKLVYSTVCERADKSDCDEPEVLLNFKKFTSIEACLEFIRNNWHDRVADDVIHCTGGGSFKYAEMMRNLLGVRVQRTDEMTSLIFGCDFLLRNNEDESFTYHHEAIGIERYQYKPIAADSIYPFLLVNIGTGISVLKVDSPSQFQRVGGSSMGGGAFIGLGNLLTSAQNFDELLLMAEKGDHRKCDTLVCDIYGGSYENLNLPADLIAGSFGKCSRMGKRGAAARGDHEQASEQDIAKSLLLMISNNIGQMAMLYGMRFSMKRIYFGGFFIRKHPITMRTLSYAINYWSKGNMEALFMKHEGYLGAVGAFLDTGDT
ncbi:pantothenate kinase [Ancylostoma caninum]|uniref:pantothenate kinase n=1 Tax=Ancylostoma caninum TaxID=29170 RepID=A0A368G3S8_ANCCA|nr:pantothenate kinase [Ancylostoma caninum]